MGLGLCAQCRRFAHPDHPCPFCGGNVADPQPIPPGRRTRTGRLVRGGLAIATAVVLGGCSSKYGGPPWDPGDAENQDDTGIDAGADAKDATSESKD